MMQDVIFMKNRIILSGMLLGGFIFSGCATSPVQTDKWGLEANKVYRNVILKTKKGNARPARGFRWNQAMGRYEIAGSPSTILITESDVTDIRIVSEE
jgi:hypothetical protein